MIEFRNIKKSYKNNVILDDFNLKIDKGNLVVLIGSSGCGKTTLLKMINRLIEATSGDILVNGKNIRDIDPIKLRRSIGYVIQQTGLFPHMTVKENIEIIPKLIGKAQEDIEKKTEELLNMVGLDPEKYSDRYPVELSGGQQQRTGVARAFAADAEIILMDEPFSALDPITRTELQEELFNIQREYKKTIVFVTHDMDEALNLADKICILKDGKILQYDTPEDILKNPAGEYVEEFVGKNKIWTKPEMIKAVDVMIPNPVTVNPKRNLLQASQIMREKKVDSLLVINKQYQLLGYITLEIIRKAENKNVLVEEMMNKEPICVCGDKSLPELLEVFNNLQKGYLPVCDDTGRLSGLVTRSSLISVLSSQYIEIGGNN
ncbi:ABC transporter ATP-binding protein [Clostridium nigeriense]|uniref:ABC transporter ATP-binding protein n=1 Tax=Clostridium nigeriense TaxID=1805470 RepID=UPI003D34DA9C